MKDTAIRSVTVSAYTVPTDSPESDGTLAWDKTTLVLVELEAGGRVGIGYTYSGVATARLLQDKLIPLLEGVDALAIAARWWEMQVVVRNLGRFGLAAAAISAVDTALWDLKGKLLELPLVTLLGQYHADMMIYGSGGFTAYTHRELSSQLGGWAEQGLLAVKMKVGREPHRDAERVGCARDAIGSGVQLFVDANGAYARKQALEKAEVFSAHGVNWFEEPVSSDDLEGLRMVRDRAPSGLEVSAGEYGYVPVDFRRMLESGSVDVLQVDATRCMGISGFLRVTALSDAFHIPLSTHTAPALHLHPACATRGVRHMEWFHDHVRIERMLFDGFVEPARGRLRPDRSRPGLGLTFRHRDAERFAV
ncbi:enolase C-terminal domain-like protein [Thiohalomonas denitrificans]|uniref:enolase C-terminal domain-like protein n=1 Tax=Thiohalomonas denitrificans TaxID=415747 RepID=UPI000B81209E|nr:enolase C-terminal domain-like protein [Thiohalomonas denitrificans]